jgi:hypothetical protein
MPNRCCGQCGKIPGERQGQRRTQPGPSGFEVSNRSAWFGLWIIINLGLVAAAVGGLLQPFDPYPFGLSATTPAHLAAAPGEVKTLIRATLEAQRAMRADPAGVSVWIAQRFEVEPDVARESYELLMPLLNEMGEVPRDAVTTFFRGQADEPAVRDTRYEDVVDTQLLQAVWQEMGLR